MVWTRDLCDDLCTISDMVKIDMTCTSILPKKEYIFIRCGVFFLLNIL
jgi:hypothetical protein